MAFPTTSVLDNFNRADEATLSGGGNWNGPTEGSPRSSLTLTSNQVTGHSTSTSSSWWAASSFGPNSECGIRIPTKNVNGSTDYLWINLATPGSTAVDGYFIAVNYNSGTDTIEVYRIDNDGFTIINSAVNQEITAGDSIGVWHDGVNTLKVYLKTGGVWSLLGTFPAATYLSGYIGLGADRDTGRLDDFFGGTVSGGGPTTFTQSVSGGITPAGAIGKYANKSLSGTLNSSGLLVKRVSKPLAGGLTSSGALSTVKVAVKAIGGALTSGGVLTRLALQRLNGGLASAGNLVRLCKSVLGGSIQPAGSLSKNISIAKSGSLALAGSVVSVKVAVLALTGSIGSSGAVRRQANKILSGGISLTGSIRQQVNRSFAGAIALSGGLAKTVKRFLAGALSLAGAVATHAVALVLKPDLEISVSLPRNVAASLNLPSAVRSSVDITNDN